MRLCVFFARPGAADFLWHTFPSCTHATRAFVDWWRSLAAFLRLAAFRFACARTAPVSCLPSCCPPFRGFRRATTFAPPFDSSTTTKATIFARRATTPELQCFGIRRTLSIWYRLTPGRVLGSAERHHPIGAFSLPLRGRSLLPPACLSWRACRRFAFLPRRDAPTFLEDGIFPVPFVSPRCTIDFGRSLSDLVFFVSFKVISRLLLCSLTPIKNLSSVRAWKSRSS